VNLRVTFSCGWSNVGVVGGLVLLSLGLIWGTNFFYIFGVVVCVSSEIERALRYTSPLYFVHILYRGT